MRAAGASGHTFVADVVSGLSARLDISRPARERVVELRVGGEPLVDKRTYRLATNSFLAEAGR